MKIKVLLNKYFSISEEDKLLENEIIELIENRADYVILEFFSELKNSTLEFLYNNIPYILLVLIIIYLLITIRERFKMEWIYKLIEIFTGKHIHDFSNPSHIEFVDGTKAYQCRCGKIAKTTE